MNEIKPDSAEFDLLYNYDFFLRKKSLSEKVMVLLGNCAVEIQQLLSDYPEVLPIEMIHQTPKISRGENLLAAPWFMLDCPRYFKGEDIFAVRTLCWFGHSFSITLHLSGIFTERYNNLFGDHLDMFNSDDYYICINENQWDHHFGPENYLSVPDYLSKHRGEKILPSNKGFLKISRKVEFDQWENLPGISRQTMNLFLNVIKLKTS